MEVKALINTPNIIINVWLTEYFIKTYTPVDTGRKLNVHKTFRSRPGRLLNVLCTFSLLPVSTGTFHNIISKIDQGWIKLVNCLLSSTSVFHWQFFMTYIFYISLTFEACYITVRWGRVQNKICYGFMYFFGTFLSMFFIIKFEFLLLSFLFWRSIKFPQQNINQSEARLGDKKLSVEL